MKSIATVLVAAFTLTLGAAGALAAEQRAILTLEAAKVIAEACEAKAAEMGWRPVIIAIYDQGADLKYFSRTDDAQRGSIQVAMLKGQTSANFPRSTRSFGEFIYKGDRPHGAQHVPGLVIFPGGLPIMTADGQHVGGVGVSGATSDQDEICAQAGIDAAAELLK